MGRSRALPLTSGRTTALLVGGCLVADLAVAAGARADELCDYAWRLRPLVVEVGERKADGTPLKAYDPDRPMVPYELPGDQYLFGHKNAVHKVIGNFPDRTAGKAALSEVERNHQQHWSPESPPVLRTLGAYFPRPLQTCTVTRRNKVIDPASWIIEQNGVLLVGATSECKKGKRTKTVTVVSCDGTKNLVTDSVPAPCDAAMSTCVHVLSPDAVLLYHSYTSDGPTSVRLRAYDVRKGKRLQSFDRTNDGGPETEIMATRDVDGDGVPELVVGPADESLGTRKVMKWRRDRFVETPGR